MSQFQAAPVGGPQISLTMLLFFRVFVVLIFVAVVGLLYSLYVRFFKGRGFLSSLYARFRGR